MFQSERGRNYLLIAALSFILSCLVVTFDFFPSFGISLSLILFALFTYRYVSKSINAKLFLILSIVFSTFLFIRSEPVISFFNFWAAVFFGILMLTSPGKRSSGFVGYLFLPIGLFFKTIFTRSSYYPAFNEGNNKPKKIKIAEAFFGVIVSFCVLAVILPLLSSSNPIFNKWLINLINVLNLEKLIEYLGFKVIFRWCVRMVFFFFCLLIIPKVITLIEKKAEYKLPTSFKLQPLPLQIPKVVTSIVLILFFVTQIQLYFANERTLADFSITYSQRTREVFGQLSVVAVVVFVLMYNSELKRQLSRKLNWLLGIEGVFLTLMAYKSVFDYIGAHGLTYKRLYGIVFATLVTGVFILYKNYFKNTSIDFVKRVILFSAFTLVLMNIVNFDYLIYHFNKPRVGYGVDYRYLSTLSADSLSYDLHFKLLEDFTFNKDFTGSYNNENPLILIHKIESLQKKYSDFDLREFNLLDYIQYRRIKDINTSQIRKYYVNNSLTSSDQEKANEAQF